MTKPVAMLQVLNTRPLPQGKVLADKLSLAGYYAISQPLFELQANTNSVEICQLLDSSRANIFIFVSVAAVEFAQQAKALTTWQNEDKAIFIAVGQSTKAALIKCGISHVETPKQENSEGVLALAALSSVAEQAIIIVRGDPGRELLAQQLTERQATVHYLSSYKKTWWPIIGNELAVQWRKQAITCIVITSVALLENTVNLLTTCLDKKIDQLNYFWLVASQRIAESAEQLQLKNIIIADGASDLAVLSAMADLEKQLSGQHDDN